MNAPFAETGKVCAPRDSERPLPERPLTVPPTVKVLVVQATATFVTFAPAIVPLPFVTVQVCVGLDGCVPTVTAYAAALARPVGNVKAPLAETGSVCAPAFNDNTRPLPDKPLTVPPTVKVGVAAHVTATLVTFAPAIVPLPLLTEQV